MARDASKIVVKGPAVGEWIDERFGIPNNYTMDGLEITLKRHDVALLHLHIALTTEDLRTLAAALDKDNGR